MRKILALGCIAAMMMALLTGCGATTDTTITKTSQEVKKTSVRKDENDNTKVLVVYYSATGSTKKAAQAIADASGGDLFELVPTEPYTDADLNWRDDGSRVCRENEDVSLRDVELTYNSLEDFDSYDTIFIGYPIWWGIAAWPVNSFVQLNDFTGKTVIPFCTSASSGMGDSGNLLQEQAGSGNWQEGKRFSSATATEDIESWVKELGISQS